jgi:hypothetical protein
MHTDTSSQEQLSKLHFIGFWPDYEEAFFERAVAEQLPVQIFNPLSRTKTMRTFAWWPRLLRNLFHKRLISTYIQAYPDAAIVAHEHRLILEVLLAKFPQRKAQILMRNPLAPNTKSKHLIQSLQALDYTIWSFDPHDCAKYGFKLYKQFIESLPQASQEPRYDFAFVGRNKGREKILQALEAKLTEQGYSVLFDIRSNETKGAKANMSYADYLQQYLTALCMIDVCQTGQTGLTLRPLEAMLYERKLLTNNALIKQEAFYNPANIFVFDESLDLTGLKAFMETPFSPVPVETQALYSVAHLAQALSSDQA